MFRPMSDPIDSLNDALQGRYILERELGEGGMATVYLARDERHDRNVAIKVLKPELAASVGADRFLREIRTTANLRHPHIVPLFDSGEVDGFLFYVMPHIEGETLRDLLDREGPLPIDRAVSIATETAGALAYAHERDVVHRDIKPANIMIESGHVVVTDFGIAGAMQNASDTRLTQTGASLGTPVYMSPEQALGDPAKAASDQYSLACVLFELVAGRPPFEGPTMLSVIAKHTIEPAPSLNSVRADTPGPVVAAVARALAKDPSDRFDDPATWCDALRVGEPSPVSVPTEAPAGIDTVGTNEALLAVLPIRCSSDDPDTRAFAEGLVEDMVSALSRYSHLQVASLSASRQVASEQSDAREAGRKLGARYVLEGSVRRGADRLRLTTQLVDVADGAHMWAETYNRKLDGDWFDLLDDLTATIVSTVADWHGVLIRSMKVAVRRKRPEDLTPDEAVILTYVYWETESSELHAHVRTSLERAVEDDPHHSNAWACLAHMYIEEIKQGHNQLPDSAGRSLEAARRAVELDPSSSMAFDALAQAQFYGDDMSGFRSSAQRAIALNPLAADVVAFMGQLLALSGEWELGMAHNRRARERNPGHPGWYYFLPFWDHFRRGEYDQALAAIQQVNMPVYFWAHLGLAAVNGQLGRKKAARAAAAEAVKLMPDVAERVRDGLRLWRLWEHCGPAYLEGLEKAGLAIPQAQT